MVVLDTHVWLWWVDDPARLSDSIRGAISSSQSDSSILVSVASIWELAIKTAANRLQIPIDVDVWVERASRYPGIIVEPIGAEDAIASTRLPRPLVHTDPFDRLLIALSRRVGAPLVTVDQKLIDYPHVVTLH